MEDRIIAAENARDRLNMGMRGRGLELPETSVMEDRIIAAEREEREKGMYGRGLPAAKSLLEEFNPLGIGGLFTDNWAEGARQIGDVVEEGAEYRQNKLDELAEQGVYPSPGMFNWGVIDAARGLPKAEPFDPLQVLKDARDERDRVSRNPINMLGYPMDPAAQKVLEEFRLGQQRRVDDELIRLVNEIPAGPVVPIDTPVDEVLGQEDALDLPNQQEGWDVDPGNVVDSSPGELFEDNDRPLNIYNQPAAPAIVAPGPGAWTAPEGTVLAPNGYYYSKAADGVWKREGRVEGYSPSQLYRAANKGAFEDPSNVSARSTPAPAARPAGQETLFDKLIGFGGTALENTALGGIAKGLFPDMWFGAGEAIKSLDNGTFSMPDEQDPDWWRSLASEVRPTAAPTTTPPPDDDDDDDDDDGGTGTGGTAPIYDRNGMVVFPDLPPYNPGRDDEWLYFRKRLANGGLVNGYAAGGEVEYSPRDPLPATAGLDPRLGLIADAEDALAGELPDPEPVLTAFVQQFGAAALDRLREQVSKGLRMRGDNARLVRGPGGPKDDAIPARINGVQEARLSDGEFVMTADAVRNAGDGDPRVGADRLMELNEMLAKGKRTDEPAPVEIVG